MDGVQNDIRADIHTAALQRFEARLAGLGTDCYELTLFVSGASGRSARAIANVRSLCDTYLADRYSLQVVDVHQHPEMLARHHVLAAPTLVKGAPLPVRTLVGDMSDTDRVLVAFDVRPTPAASEGP